MLSNPQKLGFFVSSWFEPELPGSFADASAALQAISKVDTFVNEDGFNCLVTHFHINAEEQCMAWLEWHWNDSRRIEHHEYYLCARTPLAQRLRWEVDTENPYFGVYADELSYSGGIVTLKYRDKHDTHLVRLDENNIAHQTKLRP